MELNESLDLSDEACLQASLKVEPQSELNQAERDFGLSDEACLYASQEAGQVEPSTPRFRLPQFPKRRSRTEQTPTFLLTPADSC